MSKNIVNSSNLEETKQQLKQLGFIVVPEQTFDQMVEAVKEGKQLANTIANSNFKEGVAIK